MQNLGAVFFSTSWLFSKYLLHSFQMLREREWELVGGWDPGAEKEQVFPTTSEQKQGSLVLLHLLPDSFISHIATFPHQYHSLKPSFAATSRRTRKRHLQHFPTTATTTPPPQLSGEMFRRQYQRSLLALSRRLDIGLMRPGTAESTLITSSSGRGLSSSKEEMFYKEKWINESKKNKFYFILVRLGRRFSVLRIPGTDFRGSPACNLVD